MTTWWAPYAWLGGPGLAVDVAVTVSDGVVTSADTGVPREDREALDGVLLPGLVSAHSHAFHRALRGRTHAAGGDFWAWRAPMYRLANRLDPDTYRRLAELVFAEMLAAGITTVGEFHYVHHRPDGSPYPEPNAMGRALIDAATTVGIRLTLIDTCYLASEVSGAAPKREQARFSDGSAKSWAARVRELTGMVESHPSVRLGVAAHSVRAVPADDLATVAGVGIDLGLPIHVHASEQRSENEACRIAHGMSPIQLLEEQGVLGPTTTLVHATHIDGRDRDIIAASESGVCLCPTTEADLGDGVGPAHEIAVGGVPLSLGSDSNTVIDLFEEARRTEHHDRLRLERRGVHAPDSLLAAATAGGAAALGWPELGRIEAGAAADLIVIDDSVVAGLPLEEGAALVMSATRADVTDVMVGGEWRVRAGRLVTEPAPGLRVLDEAWE